ncbi:MAG TPA: DUF3300 domain-containing protein, partial [Candidatus Binatia bacterium]|nr:DUF3300 domain-containing protein [Candidatus Binatia bacterium]
YDTYFSSDQLENLVAPVALYPDPLLAQVLLAATFPDEIDEAARTVRAYGSGYEVDSAPWDVSVKAVAHYPTVLSMMADKIDWTTSLGQAYVNQSSDLMDAVQRLRRQARSGGYLVTSPQQEIDDTDGYLYIYPAQPEYIYVPVYDPGIVFVVGSRFHAGPAIWFGTGFLIGAWLNHDCDWGHHRVFYHGWEGGGPIWIARSRSHIRINNIYVNNVYRNVAPNRRVLDRHVNYDALNRYNSIHHGVDYNNVRRARVDSGHRPVPVNPGAPHQDNKIIRRSMDPNDPRIDANRGRTQGPQPQVRQPDIPRTEIHRPDIQQPQVRQPDIPRREGRIPDTSDRVPHTTLPLQVPRTVPAPPQPSQPNVQRQPQSVFRGGGRSGGSIDAHAASQRGQESRQKQSQPVQQAKPAPQQHAPSPQRSQPSQPRGRGR